MVNETSFAPEIEEVRAKANKVRDQFNETKSQLKQQANDAWEDVADVVRRHPGKALGVALVTGVGLGALVVGLSRQKNSPSQRWNELANSGTDAWEKLRKGFGEAVCALKDAMDDTTAKFK
jgi:ElaB/YqjD/DUF883 family membrane-anchored ribosome-binding protein